MEKIMEKMKVVWLCHFCNSEVKEYFHTPEIKEFSPWIDSLIKLFKDVNNNIVFSQLSQKLEIGGMMVQGYIVVK